MKSNIHLMRRAHARSPSARTTSESTSHATDGELDANSANTSIGNKPSAHTKRCAGVILQAFHAMYTATGSAVRAQPIIRHEAPASSVSTAAAVGASMLAADVRAASYSVSLSSPPSFSFCNAVYCAVSTIGCPMNLRACAREHEHHVPSHTDVWACEQVASAVY